MSAQVIAFPRRKPMEWDELPAAWTDPARSLYQYVTYDGAMTHAQAIDLVEKTRSAEGLTRAI